MVTETRFLDQGFQLEIQELSCQQTVLYLGFLTGDPEIAVEIQIPRQVFRMETQILILISSPGSCYFFSVMGLFVKSGPSQWFLFTKISWL